MTGGYLSRIAEPSVTSLAPAQPLASPLAALDQRLHDPEVPDVPFADPPPDEEAHPEPPPPVARTVERPESARARREEPAPGPRAQGTTESLPSPAPPTREEPRSAPDPQPRSAQTAAPPEPEARPPVRVEDRPVPELRVEGRHVVVNERETRTREIVGPSPPAPPRPATTPMGALAQALSVANAWMSTPPRERPSREDGRRPDAAPVPEPPRAVERVERRIEQPPAAAPVAPPRRAEPRVTIGSVHVEVVRPEPEPTRPRPAATPPERPPMPPRRPFGWRQR